MKALSLSILFLFFFASAKEIIITDPKDVADYISNCTQTCKILLRNPIDNNDHEFYDQIISIDTKNQSITIERKKVTYDGKNKIFINFDTEVSDTANPGDIYSEAADSIKNPNLNSDAEVIIVHKNLYDKSLNILKNEIDYADKFSSNIKNSFISALSKSINDSFQLNEYEKIQAYLNSQLQKSIVESKKILNFELKDYKNFELEFKHINSKLQILDHWQSTSSLTNNNTNTQKNYSYNPASFIDFNQKLDNLKKQLLLCKAKSYQESEFIRIAWALSEAANFARLNKDPEAAEQFLYFANNYAEVVLGTNNISSASISLYALYSGHDFFTGKKLNDYELMMHALNILSLGSYKQFSDLTRYIIKSSRIYANENLQQLHRIHSFFKTAYPDNIMDNKTLRRVHLRSKNPKWGISDYHLDKHFSGDDSKHALKLIDPKGNIEIWMKNVESLLQKEATNRKIGGIIEIKGVFKKTDSEGYYKLGIRLQQTGYKDYDLITFLSLQD